LPPPPPPHKTLLRVHFQNKFEDKFSCVLGGTTEFEESAQKMSRDITEGFDSAIKLAIPAHTEVVEKWGMHREVELSRLHEDIQVR
ncbi:unnamed protein product, partial [Choristocarpus tenellus]